ncbi:MAG TPA: putative PEP-binding protein, partial [Paracoccaceae bacterium]|nr:putative PEP-binding protein [Paracoccaceae bacterium]
MSRAGTERVFRGAPAAPGLAIGPALRLPAGPRATARRAGDPEAEGRAFTAALAEAGAALSALGEPGDTLASEILAFQLALLEDDDLLDPIRAEIARGEPADAAWLARMDAEIADLAAESDPYMAARAADLRDLRDRVLAALRGGGEALGLPEAGVVLADDLAPSSFLALDWGRLGGAALTGGSATSHVAILARARGVPMLVGLDAAADPEPGEWVALDADEGVLIVAPAAATRAALAGRMAAAAAGRARAEEAALRPAVTADGRLVRVMVNLDDLAALDRIAVETCDGVGLMRSEFLYSQGAPDEAAQFAAYARILAWAKGRPVTIRTLDAGGDKPIPGITQDGEANPFLGLRGLRLSLARPEIFRIQLRALARAAALGPLKVMLPMV